MPTIYDLKPGFQTLLRPICRRLAAAGVRANHVTIGAVVWSAAAGAAIAWQPEARWPLCLFPAVALVRMALNAVDGMLAREFGQASRLGAVLNEVGDVVSDAAMYLPLAWVPAIPAPAVVVLVCAGLVVELTGVVGVQLGASRRYDGPTGKSDRAFVFSAVALLLGAGVAPGAWVAVVLWLAVAGSAWTVVNRARRALAEAGAAV